MKFTYDNKKFELNLNSNKINCLTKTYSKIDFNNRDFSFIKKNQYVTNIKGDSEFNKRNFLNKLNNIKK